MRATMILALATASLLAFAGTAAAHDPLDGGECNGVVDTDCVCTIQTQLCNTGEKCRIFVAAACIEG